MPNPSRWSEGGFHLLRGLASAQEQRELAEAGREVARAAPFVRPRMPDGTPFRYDTTAAGEALFFSDRARGYHYSRQHPTTCNSLPEMPRIGHVLGLRALVEAGVSRPGFVFDTMLINRYDAEYDESLGLHVDIQEADLDAPFTVHSLGADCEFLVGGLDRGFNPDIVTLSSGDAIVMSGNARLWFHGVRRTRHSLFSPLPPGIREAYSMRRAF
jgi:alkylated DNA repair protein (DNA oxidative demethylase)